jgi:hypothetical protein
MSSNAQNTFNEGDKALNTGLGFGSTLYTGAYYTSKILIRMNIKYKKKGLSVIGKPFLFIEFLIISIL